MQYFLNTLHSYLISLTILNVRLEGIHSLLTLKETQEIQGFLCDWPTSCSKPVPGDQTPDHTYKQNLLHSHDTRSHQSTIFIVLFSLTYGNFTSDVENVHHGQLTR